MRPEDFLHRAEPETLPELMDQPCSYPTLAACLRDLERVNRLFGAYRPTLAFLRQFARQHSGPLRILDVGCGHGDMLRRIALWANQNQQPVQLTGIDLNQNAIAAAREATPNGSIRWLHGDATALHEPFDVILSSLVTHHMATPQVIHFVRWMEQTALRGWFINDLERQYTPALWFGRLARLLRWHPFVQHDGPVSFRRAFRESDWQAILAQAGLAPAAATIRKEFPARLCVARLR